MSCSAQFLCPRSTLDARSLPEKIAADPTGRLVFFGFTDIGILNNVVELWRYPSAQASIKCVERLPLCFLTEVQHVRSLMVVVLAGAVSLLWMLLFKAWVY